MTPIFKKNNLLFKTIFDKMSSHIIIGCDMADKIIYINKTGEAYIGSEYQSIKNRKLTELYDNSFISILIPYFFIFKKELNQYNHEISILEKNDEKSYYSIWFIPYIENNSYSGCIITMENITERKEQELAIKKENEKLNELISLRNNKYNQLSQKLIDNIEKLKNTTIDLANAEKNYQLIYDYSILGMYRVTLEGKIIDMNMAFKNLMNIPNNPPESKILISDLNFFLDKEDYQLFWNILKKGKKIIEFETQFINANSKDINVSLHASLVETIYTKPFALIIVEDITYKKFSENMLFEYYDLIQTILDKIPNPIFYKNINGQYRGCNDAFCKVTGLNKNDIIGKSPKQIPLADYFEIDCQKDKELFENKQSISYDAKFSNKNGESMDVIVSKALYFSKDGKPAGIVGSLTDIEELRKNEQNMKDTIKNKELLIKEIHHRVKNNFNMIFNLLQLEEMNIQDEKVLSIIKDIQSRVKTMSSLHKNFYESGVDGFIQADEYIHQLAEDLIKSFTRKNIQFELKSVPEKLNIDTVVPFGLILTELITNSIKHGFSDDEKGKINIVFHETDKNLFTFSYEDSGKGLQEDFDFTQVKSLGMHLIKGLIKQLKGEIININSYPFRFTFQFTIHS